MFTLAVFTQGTEYSLQSYI